MKKEKATRLCRIFALTAASVKLFCGCSDKAAKKSEETVSQGTVTYSGEEI